MVQEAVEQGRGDDGVAEDLAPFGEAAIGGQGQRAALVAGIDQLEEQVAASGADGAVADFAADQRSMTSEESDSFAQVALALGLAHGGDQFGQRGEVDAFAGLKLEVEPSVYRDDEVGIKLTLEVSNVVREVLGPASSLAFQLGTRSASTALRLRNGETQVLAGLINDEDRSAAQRLPGLGDLPILGRLFSAQRDSNNRTEIALLTTPRILRNVLPPVALLADMPAGTETSVGREPLRLGVTAPGSLGLFGDGRAAAPVVPRPIMPERDEAEPPAAPAPAASR
jgi:hypothetical protein